VPTTMSSLKKSAAAMVSVQCPTHLMQLSACVSPTTTALRVVCFAHRHSASRCTAFSTPSATQRRELVNAWIVTKGTSPVRRATTVPRCTGALHATDQTLVVVRGLGGGCDILGLERICFLVDLAHQSRKRSPFLSRGREKRYSRFSLLHRRFWTQQRRLAPRADYYFCASSLLMSCVRRGELEEMREEQLVLEAAD